MSIQSEINNIIGYRNDSYAICEDKGATMPVNMILENLPDCIRSIGSGGVGKVETLWTNNSPTSSFAAQDITLSDIIQNYDMIQVTFLFSTSSVRRASKIYLVDDIKSNQDTGHNVALESVGGSNNRISARVFYFKRISGTAGTQNGIHFNAASSNSSTANTYLIPFAVYGIKL